MRLFIAMLGMKQTPHWKIKSFCMNHIVSCDIIHANVSNEMFNIGTFEKLAICVFDNELHDVGVNLWKTDKENRCQFSIRPSSLFMKEKSSISLLTSKSPQFMDIPAVQMSLMYARRNTI